MAVAVLSDIHGVLPVLNVILAEPDVAAAELIMVTGDHVAGPDPVGVLDRLLDLGDRVRLVRGNADRELVDLARGNNPDGAPDISLWAARQLSENHLEVLANLPHPLQLSLPGFGEVVFCHGTPRDDNEVVLVDTPIERWAEIYADLPAAVRTVVCGHTHMPFVRLVNRRLVINPGSVGMPYGRAGGAWALLHDGQVELRHTPIDIAAVCDKVAWGCSYDKIRDWVGEYITAANSDVDALRVMAPRDGRRSPPS